MGIVLVACMATRGPSVPPSARMTSTLSATSSAARAGSRSTLRLGISDIRSRRCGPRRNRGHAVHGGKPRAGGASGQVGR
jgi:hypothetical protein